MIKLFLLLSALAWLLVDAQKFCQQSCNCSSVKECAENVTLVKDKCGCCMVCAKQLNEPCAGADMCEPGLTCGIDVQTKSSVCKVSGKPCTHRNGLIYADNETFQPDCKHLCTCQSGRYGCISLCSHELKRPVWCPSSAKLVAVPGQCCQEWICSQMPPYMYSENEVLGHIAPAITSCPSGTTDWSPCSQTCGFGYQQRIVSRYCKESMEIKVCMIRPCNISDIPFVRQVKNSGSQMDGRREDCTPTRRLYVGLHIVHDDCESKKTYKLKYCTTCRPGYCCNPSASKSKSIKMVCQNGKKTKRVLFDWIKRCKCRPCSQKYN